MNRKRPVNANWRDHAACIGADPNLFTETHDRTTDAVDQRQRTALRHCLHCPVRDECGAEADENNWVGIWGGIYRTQSSRKPLRRHNLLPEWTRDAA